MLYWWLNVWNTINISRNCHVALNDRWDHNLCTPTVTPSIAQIVKTKAVKNFCILEQIRLKTVKTCQIATYSTRGSIISPARLKRTTDRKELRCEYPNRLYAPYEPKILVEKLTWFRLLAAVRTDFDELSDCWRLFHLKYREIENW